MHYGELQRKIVMVLTLELIFVFAVVLVAFLAFPTPKKRAIFVGILCVILNIIMYASPLTVMVCFFLFPLLYI